MPANATASANVDTTATAVATWSCFSVSESPKSCAGSEPTPLPSETLDLLMVRDGVAVRVDVLVADGMGDDVRDGLADGDANCVNDADGDGG